MKLYTIEKTYSFVVLANSEEEAENIVARENTLDEADIFTREISFYKGKPVLPNDWDLDCLIFHEAKEDIKEDISVEDALKNYYKTKYTPSNAKGVISK